MADVSGNIVLGAIVSEGSFSSRVEGSSDPRLLIHTSGIYYTLENATLQSPSPFSEASWADNFYQIEIESNIVHLTPILVFSKDHTFNSSSLDIYFDPSDLSSPPSTDGTGAYSFSYYDAEWQVTSLGLGAFQVEVYPEDYSVNSSTIHAEFSDGASRKPAIFSFEEFQIYSVSNSLNITEVTSDALIPPITIEGFADAGHNVFSYRRFSDIESEGFLLFAPLVSSSYEFETIETVDENNFLVAVAGSVSMGVIGDIKHLFGRVIYGFPEAPIFRQVYELSNDGSLEILTYPENASYPVQMPTTEYDRYNNKLRRGTVYFQFKYDHDTRQISKIEVWVRGPNGVEFKDKMEIIDYPLGNYKDHILYEPFKKTGYTSIPIHCCNNKKYQFFAKIYYSPSDDLDRYSIGEEEVEVVEFQPHFEDLNSYINLADHIPEFIAPAGRSGAFKTISVQRSVLYNSYEERMNNAAPSGNKGKFQSETTEFTLKYLVYDDKINMSAAAGNKGKFKSESIALGSGTIGG